MGKKGDGDGLVKLGGYEFKKVINGLDEAQVETVINELISKREHSEHLSSLTKLAEKTVAEADKLAEEIKTDAKEQAKAEASAIITKAEERAQQISEEKRTEIINIATEQAEAIKTEAKQEAELLLENQRKKIHLELSDLAHQLYSRLLSEFESLKEQVVGSDKEFKHKLFHLAEETSTITVEQDERHDEFVKLIQTEDQESTGEPDWQVEILPPIDITKIMGVVTHLDNVPEIERTEIIPETDKPSIMVFLGKPIDLINVMSTIPGVDQVKEDTTQTADVDTKPKKVQIVLNKETVLDDIKERFNNEIYNILSIQSSNR